MNDAASTATLTGGISSWLDINLGQISPFSQFISGREINAASAFKFYLNVVLIEMGLQIATVPGARRCGTPVQPTP